MIRPATAAAGVQDDEQAPLDALFPGQCSIAQQLHGLGCSLLCGARHPGALAQAPAPAQGGWCLLPRILTSDVATQAQRIMRDCQSSLFGWNDLPDGLASHSAIMPAVPDAEVVGTFHAPPYEVLLLDLQGGALSSIWPCMMCTLESAAMDFVEICPLPFAGANHDM